MQIVCGDVMRKLLQDKRETLGFCHNRCEYCNVLKWQKLTEYTLRIEHDV
jgi:hypothetical protein